MATVIYDRPTDARVFGSLEVDVTDALALIQQRRAEGTRLTITHLLTAAVARTLAQDVPELNCFVRWGRVRPREDVSIMLAVDVGGRDMSGVLVRRAHHKSASQISQELQVRVERSRAGTETNATVRRKNSLARLPWVMRRPAFKLIRWAVYEAGINLRFSGLHEDMFGSVVITNIGTLGLHTGYAALLPASNVPFVLAVGRIQRKPVVIDEQIVIRSMLPLSGTFDHRLADGHQVGVLAQGVKDRLLSPAELDEQG